MRRWMLWFPAARRGSAWGDASEVDRRLSHLVNVTVRLDLAEGAGAAVGER